jgi:synaptobrevin family protein YKT6
VYAAGMNTQVKLMFPAYTFHVYGRSEGIAGVIISDREYPSLVAHQILSRLVDEFLAEHPVASFQDGCEIAWPKLKDYLTKYQDPQNADSIMKIQKELDETKILMKKTIESVLERGEKIDSLVAKSDGLSAQSKMFYKSVGVLRLHLRLWLTFPRRRTRTLVACSCK